MALNFRFLAVKGIPELFWSSRRPLTFRPRPVSMLFLVVGLALFGLGEALMVAASIGVSPWTVLAQGVAGAAGWSLGLATLIISVCVLICWIPLRQVPGVGTILNVIIIAAVLEFALPFLPRFDSPLLRGMEAVAGVLITGFGGAIYLVANLGPGPRDGLMTGLQTLTDLPIAWVRSGLEVAVICVGWSLGGQVGPGTLIFAFGIGPAIALGLYGLQSAFPRRAT